MNVLMGPTTVTQMPTALIPLVVSSVLAMKVLEVMVSHAQVSKFS